MTRSAPQHVIPGVGKKQVLVMAQDAWLRLRLGRELERAGCEVFTLVRLRSGQVLNLAFYDVVLIDAELLGQNGRSELLKALRAESPHTRFMLLVSPRDRVLAELARKSGFDRVLGRPTEPEALAEIAREVVGEFHPRFKAVPIPVAFDVLVERPEQEGKRRALTTFSSLVVHTLVVAMALVIPLMYTEVIDIRQLSETWLVAPPPAPPPPPPAPAAAMQPRRIKPVLQTPTGKLVAPTVIPREITRIVELTDVESEISGVIGGVPGGVPGGQLGGVIGGVIGGIPAVVPKPMAPPPKPVRVGGRIREPRLIKRVDPFYPLLARQARIEGVVRIDAIIDETGHVVEMKALSGHPVLVAAALQAVQQWVYEPTYLNEQPVPILLEVTVHFRLSQSER